MNPLDANTQDYVVKDTDDLRRILALPRRREEPNLVEEMTDALRRPGGTMTLRPVQAQALYDLGTEGGLFGALRVGSGKTAISLLAPVVTFAERPLLLVPAKLLAKTRHDQSFLSQHWDLPYVRIMSYEWLGRVQAADSLWDYNPDLIIADECHKLRNASAAVTRRVSRYFAEHDETTKCVAMSGTITKRSLHDYAHILRWVYPPEKYPLPVAYTELEIWADALDARKSQKRARPGALQLFCQQEGEKELWKWDPRRAARQSFRRHFVMTPGVVATHETPIDASLVIESVTPDVGPSPSVDNAFSRLRFDWVTPDGWELMDGLELFRHARELALGFYYKWDPRPPQSWLMPRKAWAKFVRQEIKYSRKYDSELQVRQAFPMQPELLAWKDVQETFEPNTVPVWIDDYIIPLVENWAKRNNGIIWTEHRCVAERLEAETGLTYYGRRGLSAHGQPIEQHPPGSSMIASIQSNGEGRNLQAWNANLILSMPPNGSQTEQLLGRTHRDGQEADEVTVDILMVCREHVEAFEQARKDCEYVHDSTGSPQKLLDATVNVIRPLDIWHRTGARW